MPLWGLEPWQGAGVRRSRRMHLHACACISCVHLNATGFGEGARRAERRKGTSGVREAYKRRRGHHHGTQDDRSDRNRRHPSSEVHKWTRATLCPRRAGAALRGDANANFDDDGGEDAWRSRCRACHVVAGCPATTDARRMLLNAPFSHVPLRAQLVVGVPNLVPAPKASMQEASLLDRAQGQQQGQQQGQ